MEIKKCSKCGISKELSEYHNFKHSKDGKKSACKLCISEYNKQDLVKIKKRENHKKWISLNPNKNKENKKRHYIKHKSYINQKNRLYGKLYREKNKDILKEENTERYIDFNKKVKIREYKEKNKDRINEQIKNLHIINKEKYAEKRKEYRKSEKALEMKRQNYHKNKDKMKHIIAWRSVLSNTIKRFGTKKENKTIDLLGYSATELKECMEKKFLPGMSWSNWGEWHIDHIKPVSSFSNCEKVSIVCSLDNLQPLWSGDNLSKGKKIIKKD